MAESVEDHVSHIFDKSQISSTERPQQNMDAYFFAKATSHESVGLLRTKEMGD